MKRQKPDSAQQLRRAQELDRARADFETQMQGVRLSMSDKLGLRPRRRGWWTLLLAGAVGVALAGRTAPDRRQLDEGA